MTDSADDAPSIPDIRGDGLQSLRGRVVIERRMTGGREENSVRFLFKSDAFLSSTLDKP